MMRAWPTASAGVLLLVAAMSDKQLTLEQAELVEDHIDLIKTIARNAAYRAYRAEEMNEILAVSYLALCEAAITFDAARGPFRPHAIVTVKRALSLAQRKASQAFHMPDTKYRLLVKMRDAVFGGGAQTQKEVAEMLGVNLRSVKELWPFLSFGAASDIDGNACETTAGARGALSVAEQVADAEEERQVRRAVSSLPAAQRKVIEHRFGWVTGTAMLTEEIAAALGWDEVQVSYTEKAAMEALRSILVGGGDDLGAGNPLGR